MITELEVALVADLVFRLIVFRESPLVLPTPVTYGARTPLAVMTTLLLKSAKLLGKRFMTRETLLKVLWLVLAFEVFREPLIAFFLFPQLMILHLYMLCLRGTHAHQAARCMIIAARTSCYKHGI